MSIRVSSLVLTWMPHTWCSSGAISSRVLAVLLTCVMMTCVQPWTTFGDEIRLMGNQIFDSDEFVSTDVEMYDDGASRSIVAILDGARIHDLDLSDQVVATMTGGEVRDDFVMLNLSTLQMLGGSIGELTVSDNSVAVLSRGSIDTLELSQHARGLIQGGNILRSIELAGDAVLTVIGSNVTTNDGRLMGNLADGSILNVPLLLQDNARVVTYAIPEGTSQSLCVAGVSAFIIGRRKYL